jgi:hypothetical protein
MSDPNQIPSWMETENGELDTSILDNRPANKVIKFYNNLQRHTEHQVPPEAASRLMAQYIKYEDLPVGEARAATLADYGLGSRDFQWEDGARITCTTADTLRTQVNNLPIPHSQTVSFFQGMENRPVQHIFHLRCTKNRNGEYNPRIDGFDQEHHIDIYQYHDTEENGGNIYPDDITPLEEGMLPNYAIVITKKQPTGLYYNDNPRSEERINKKAGREEPSTNPTKGHVSGNERRPEMEPAGVDIHRPQTTDDMFEKMYRLLHNSGYHWQSIKDEIEETLQ